MCVDIKNFKWAAKALSTATPVGRTVSTVKLPPGCSRKNRLYLGSDIGGERNISEHFWGRHLWCTGIPCSNQRAMGAHTHKTCRHEKHAAQAGEEGKTVRRQKPWPSLLHSELPKKQGKANRQQKEYKRHPHTRMHTTHTHTPHASTYAPPQDKTGSPSKNKLCRKRKEKSRHRQRGRRREDRTLLG